MQLRATMLFLLMTACQAPAGDLAQTDEPPEVTDPTGQAPSAATEREPDTGPHHERCAWIGQDTYEKGVATYLANPDYFTAIHPKWYELSEGGTIRTFANAGDRRVVETARAHGALLMPMIADRKVEGLRAMLATSASRTAHIGALVSLVVDGGYDGIDIDYEHLWSAADRPGYEAFVTELASRLHAAGKVVSVAVPGLTAPKKAAAYDYPFLAATVDVVHLMGYDFHTVGTHSGPVAPLGWVEAVVAYAASVDPGQFVLAMPNYGVTETWYGDSATSARECATPDTAVTDHMDSCPLGHYAAGRAPHCTRANGQTLYFDDLGSFMQKVEVAHRYALAGVSHWTVGGEPPGFFEMVRRSF